MSLLENIHYGKKVAPPRILLYGYEGCGKSTFASKLPKPIFIPTEDGIGQIDTASFPLAKTFADVMNDIQALVEEKHDFQTLVIDSLSALERMIHADICRIGKVQSIEMALGGYGKGYKFAAENYWEPLLRALDKIHEKPMMILMTAHVATFTVQGPDGAFDRIGPMLHKMTRGILHQWTDATLLAEQKGRIVEKNGQTLAQPMGKDGGDRVMRCIGSISTIAKNRYGLPYEMPLDATKFMDAIASAPTEEVAAQ